MFRSHSRAWARVGLTLVPILLAAHANPRLVSGDDHGLGAGTTMDSSVTLRDSMRVRAQAQSHIVQFLARWRLAWYAADSVHRRSEALEARLARHAYVHCHDSDGGSEGKSWRLRSGYKSVQEVPNAFAKCPTWTIGAQASGADEAERIDGVLLPAARVSMQAARDSLLVRLDEAHKVIPGDAWLVGQRVRFRVDQGQLDIAAGYARDCTTDRWWCAVLLGYVLHAQGDPVRADSAFMAATTTLPAATRCSWTSVTELLPVQARAPYGALNCSAQDSLAARYWWLADRSWSDSVNERRAEHFARKTLILLRSGLPEDEVQRWYPAVVGRTLTEMLLRYGWPTATQWGGQGLDASHDVYLRERGATPSPPYSNAEYSPNRIHLAPTWAAVLDPFHAESDAWEINAPSAVKYDVLSTSTMWWPQEHMKSRNGPLLQLPPGQMALLRRADHVKVMVAIDGDERTDAPLQLSTLLADSITSALVVSEQPGTSEVLVQQSSQLLSRLMLVADLRPRPVVIDVEVRGRRARSGDARNRHGLMPPPTLRELPASELAISDPIFYDATEGGAPPADADALIPRMMGRTDIAQESKVGVFWETYGATVGDSLRYEVNVSPVNDPSLLRRLGTVLRLMSGSDKTAIAFNEVDRRTPGGTASPQVSIIPRALTLSFAGLPKGSYWLELVVSTPGRQPVRSRRAISIR